MKIERGIIAFSNDNEMIVCSPGRIHQLNYDSFYRRSLSDNQNVLGVIINDRFSICREFITTTGHIIFGFIINKAELPNQFQILSMVNFDHKTFNPFDSNYPLGNDAVMEIA